MLVESGAMPLDEEGVNPAGQMIDAVCAEWGWSKNHCGMCIIAFRQNTCLDSDPKQPLTIQILSHKLGNHC